MLVDQQPSLVTHLRKKYDYAGKALFEDANAWFALSEIFVNILQDPYVRSTYLIVDALDECVTDLPKLLDFIIQLSSVSPHVKWIVSSRNWPGIEERLEKSGRKARIHLELNAQSVSLAVSAFIRHKVLQLAERKGYDAKTRDAVRDHLSSNANDTFLWVALVCQNLEEVPRRSVIKKLTAFPPGLNSLYERMLQQISESDDADLCKRILASIAISYRPTTLAELVALVEQLEDVEDDYKSICEIIGRCGSFLTLREDTVYFVHQSAKDFLFTRAYDEVFPTGTAEVHYSIFSRSLEVLSRTLCRDMYDLRRLGYPAEKIKPPVPDPLAASRYSCIYWVDHLYDCNRSSSAFPGSSLQAGGAVDKFLSAKYLCWLEALSLCQSMSKGVVSMAKLANLAQERTDAFALQRLIYDAHRFIMYHKVSLENFPLQTYASALLFSPARSLIRRLFKEEAPTWVAILPDMQDDWDACLQTLEGHNVPVESVVFSHDSNQLASAAFGAVKIWDVVSGQCLQTLEAHDEVNSVAFSHDSKQLATVLKNHTVHIWSVMNGKCLLTLKCPATLEVRESFCGSIKFSHDSTQLVSTCFSNIAVWDMKDNKCLRILDGHSDQIHSLSFSYDSKRLASGSNDDSIKIWDVDGGKCLKTLECNELQSIALFHDSKRLISASYSEIAIWNVNSGERLREFSNGAGSVAVSRDSTQFATSSSSSLSDGIVRIWDVNTGECLHTLQGHSYFARSVAFSHDSTRLSSGSGDGTVKIWDLSQGRVSQRQGSNELPLGTQPMAISQDSTQLAVVFDSIVEMRDVQNGKLLHTLEGHSGEVISIAFSPDSTQLASGSADGTVKLWNLGTARCFQTLHGHRRAILSIDFSYSSTQLGSVSEDGNCKVWDISTGTCLRTIENCYTGEWYRNTIVISHDLTQLASILDMRIIEIWNTVSGEHIQTIKDIGDISSIAFAKSSKRLASAFFSYMVRIWDLNNGECLHTFDVHAVIHQMSFDDTDAYLHTNIGTIDINASITHTDGAHPQARYRGLAANFFSITYNSEVLLCIPVEFRPRYKLIQVAEKAIGTIDGSRRSWMYSFDLDALSVAQEQYR
ncbi:Nn.00g036650.m01.CDS01 [Neocucurbitaria sp. VM-36]